MCKLIILDKLINNKELTNNMITNEEHPKRKNIIFLSSSFVNLAKIFAEKYNNYNIFLILDRKFPIEFEDLDNFYPIYFNKNKLFEKDKIRYFDNLALYINNFEPDIIITNNYTKLLPKTFIDFFKIQNKNLKIINIHHADLRIKTKNKMKYQGLSADIKQMLYESKIISTIHLIENEEMDKGKQIKYSHETSLKELKQKGYIHKKEDILNLRLRNVILSYHERTKILKILKKVIEKLT